MLFRSVGRVGGSTVSKEQWGVGQRERWVGGVREKVMQGSASLGEGFTLCIAGNDGNNKLVFVSSAMHGR